MKRNHIFFIAGALVCFLIVFNSQSYVVSYSPAPPPGRTGSIGDGGATCTGCHNGSAIPVSDWVTSDIPISGYIPEATYTVNITAIHSTAQKIGFEASSENSSGVNVGSFVVTDVTRTGIVGTDYIGHKLAGVVLSTAGENAWSFDWIAPVSGTGDVTFYAAINAANGNNLKTGDTVYTSSLTVQEDSPLGVLDNIIGKHIVIYPNPVSEYAFVSLGADWKGWVSIVVYNIAGSVLLKEENILGEIVKLDMWQLKSGTYFVSLKNNERQRVIRKIMVQ